jgi:hypothetical protein
MNYSVKKGLFSCGNRNLVLLQEQQTFILNFKPIFRTDFVAPNFLDNLCSHAVNVV